MNINRRLRLALASLTIAGWTTHDALGQCVTRDFEEFAPGTVLTTPYPGVSFSAEPASCPGGADVFVVVPDGGASSGTKAITVEEGCPSFSPETLVIRFTIPQRYVTFTVGTTIGADVTVRSYNAMNDGATISMRTYGSSDTVNGLVRVGAEDDDPLIHRIEIEAATSDFEYLDDLSYDWDITPPEATITSPTFLQCFCEGDFIFVRGTACDADGAYGNDRLEWRSVSAPESDPWTLVGSFTTPLCAPGTLYALPAADLPNGPVYLRLTVTNACGLSSTAITVAQVDRAAPGIAIDKPIEEAALCGVVDVCGAVTDGCAVSWTMRLTPQEGGDIIELDSAEGSRCGLLSTFDTADIAPGAYKLSIDAVDACGQASNKSVDVFVNEQCPVSADLDGDGSIGFGDLLIILSLWSI